MNSNNCEYSPMIKKAEIKKTIQLGKGGKAHRLDSVFVKLLKQMDNQVINFITKFFNSIFLELGLHSNFIPIRKKHSAKSYRNYRRISLLVARSKWPAHRLASKLNQEQMLLQRYRDLNWEVFVSFIYYK